jgi:hypothetical protein
MSDGKDILCSRQCHVHETSVFCLVRLSERFWKQVSKHHYHCSELKTLRTVNGHNLNARLPDKILGGIIFVEPYDFLSGLLSKFLPQGNQVLFFCVAQVRIEYRYLVRCKRGDTKVRVPLAFQ